MIQILFTLPAILFLISGLPQTFRMLKRKSACDLSPWTYGITLTAILIVVINAIVEQVWTIALSNGVSLITVSINFYLILKYQHHAKNK